MKLQIIYDNSRTGEHEHYAELPTSVVESFEDESIDEQTLLNSIENQGYAQISFGFGTTTMKPAETFIEFYTENGQGSCPYCTGRGELYEERIK